MTYKLRTNLLEVSVDHPLTNYQTSRFDWTGKISDVKFRGIPMTITEKYDGRQENLYGKGLYNEFSMDTALGFEEAEMGGWFHKIGVGLLKKDGTYYDFFKPYFVKPANFIINKEENRLVIECISDSVNGYSYHLIKEILLDDDRLQLKYWLKNTGKKKIETEEYAHNFLSINHAPVSPDYELKFPFQIQTDKFGKTINPNNLIGFDRKCIEFYSTTNDQFLVSNLNGDSTVKAQWQLIHKVQKLGVSETATFQTSKVNMWGWKHVISPEMFHNIVLNPGETEEWSRTYHFYNIQ